jgi:anti-sigma regulatory factor (Ser/Thr protein kinase)
VNGVEDAVEHVTLRQDARAAGDARDAARRTLTRWRMPVPTIEAVVLAVSELVTNAIRYGRPPVALTLSRRRRDVRVDVSDEGGGYFSTARRPASPDADSGRGLAIVTAIAESVGCDTTAGQRGKTVYATFLLPALALSALGVHRF